MNKQTLVSLAWAAAILLVSAAAALARTYGYIGQETALRVVAMNGLVVAYYGNLIPKVIAPNATARRVTRFAGWTLVLSGLAYAVLWAFAPLPIAMTAGTGALALGIVITVVYCFRLRAAFLKPGKG